MLTEKQIETIFYCKNEKSPWPSKCMDLLLAAELIFDKFYDDFVEPETVTTAKKRKLSDEEVRKELLVAITEERNRNRTELISRIRLVGSAGDNRIVKQLQELINESEIIYVCDLKVFAVHPDKLAGIKRCRPEPKPASPVEQVPLDLDSDPASDTLR